MRGPDIKPVNGKFSLTVKPGYVYSLTTTSGQGKGTAVSPPAAALPLPYRNNLSAGNDEPALLAAEDGSFELASCAAPDGAATCTKQTARRKPVLWANSRHRHPYAIIGSDWASYAVSVDVMLPRSGSAGLIGRYHAVSPAQGSYDGYVFNVSTDGRFALKLSNGGTAVDTIAGERQVTPATTTVLAAGPGRLRETAMAHPVPVAVGPDHPGERRRAASRLGDQLRVHQRDTGHRGRRLVPGLLLEPGRNTAVRR